MVIDMSLFKAGSMIVRSITPPPRSHQSQHSLRCFKQVCGVALGAMTLTLGIAQGSWAEVATQQAAVKQATPTLLDSLLGNIPERETSAREATDRGTSILEATVLEATAIEATDLEAATDLEDQAIDQTKTAAAVPPPIAPTPEPEPFSPLITGITDISTSTDTATSVGHLRPSNIEGFATDNVDWLQSAIVPLYGTPGGEHWGWIYQGWLIPKGQNYLAIGRDAGFVMIRPYDTLHTFPVLETRDDGWFEVQYTSNGSAWAHTSQLALGDTPLTLETWEDHLGNQASIQFLDKSQAQPLRSQPQSANNMLSLVPTDSLIEPKAVQGDWILVQVTRPTANCTPLTGATVTEGWMRWRAEDGESLVARRPDASCAQ